MLAAYMRMKYPHLVEGAIAASAPFKWVTGEEPLHPFFEHITTVLNEANSSCVTVLRNAYQQIQEFAKSDSNGAFPLQIYPQQIKPTSSFFLRYIPRNGYPLC